MSDKATVHLYPVEGASVYPYPADEIDVTAAEAKALLAYEPPAFTTEPPKGVKAKPEQPEEGTP
jgi:hypothetical protein